MTDELTQTIPIPPVDDQSGRPYWSVMIPTYNRHHFLAIALRSLLAHDPGPDHMQIQVIDNATPGDDVERVVRDIGGDRVEFCRQKENLGAVGNWNACLTRARGRWVHLLHDDDILLPGFYPAYEKFIKANPDVGLIFSRSVHIDSDERWQRIDSRPTGMEGDGLIPDALRVLVQECEVRFPTAVLRRDLLARTGGFNPVLGCAADWEMWMRLARCAPVGYVDQPRLLYRMHPQSASSNTRMQRELCDGSRRSVEYGLTYLPAEQRQAAKRSANRVCSRMYYRLYRNSLRARDTATAWYAARWMYRLNPSLTTARRLIRAAAAIGWMKLSVTPGDNP